MATATDDTTNISYTYDASGLRTSKTVDGVTHYYYYAGGKLLRETYGDNTLDFFYDENGYPYAFEYNGALYYYITNLHGDVEYILNSSRNIVGQYWYDPYGNIVYSYNTPIEKINPLRYRGYYFDSDSGLYYLQSRYYDPAIGRFINADVYTSTGQGMLGNNMFAYCRNNPINRMDVAGTADVDYTQEKDGNPLDDLMYSAGGGGSSLGCNYSGYAYAENPIDAAYYYYPDCSSSIYSSLYTGLYQNGYFHVESYRASPNPGGRKGGEAHRSMIQTIKSQLENNGFEVIEEYRVNTPGGYKDVRYLDLYATNGQDSFGVQVGRMTKGGAPVARELRALGDLSCANIYVVFVAYN